MDVLLGIFLVLFGLVIAFVGLQVFFAILPIVGFVLGFYSGAALIEALFGDGFLSTATGWVVGGIVGAGFALIAYLWWYMGVLLSSGALGAVLASGLAEAIGVSSGFVLLLFGVLGGTLLVFLTIALNLPVVFVIVNTAIVGASIVVTGLLLVFNQVDREELAEGAAVTIINESWWWVLASFVIAVIGISRQLSIKESVHVPEQRWVPGTSGAAAS